MMVSRPEPEILATKRYLLVSGDELLMVSRNIEFGSGDVYDCKTWSPEYSDDGHSEEYELINTEGLEYSDENQDGYREECELNEDDVDDDEVGWNVHLVEDDNDDDSEDDVDEDKVDEIPEWMDDRFKTYLYKTDEFVVFKLDNDENGEKHKEDEDDNVEDSEDDEEADVEENEEEHDEEGEDEEDGNDEKDKKKERLIWVKVNSPDDRMLFVGNNFGLSFSANDFPECKANHIYFTDDHLFGYNKNLIGGHDLGAYNMKTGKVESLPCFLKSTWLIWPPPCWVTLSAY